MNKRIVIICAAMLGISGQAMAANLFTGDAGSLDVTNKTMFQHKFVAHGTNNGIDDSYDRLGVKGKLKLNDNFSAVGNYEGQVNLDTYAGQPSARSVYGTRLLNGGLDAGSAGVLTVGRHTGVVYNVSGTTDVAPGVLSGYSADADTGLLGRADNIIQYRNDVAGVQVTGQYKLEKDGRSLENHWNTVNEGRGYGVSLLATDIGGTGFGLGGAYATTETATGKDAPAGSVAAIYSANGVYAAVTHTVGKNYFGQKSFRDDEVITQYTFSNGVTPSLGYVDTDVRGVTKSVETGISYSFNKNVTGYVDLGWDTTGNSNHVAKTGLGYSF